MFRKDDLRIILIGFFLLFGVTDAFAKEVDCGKHPIYCNIVDKRPDMSKSKAMKLSNLIYKYAKKYKQDPHLSIAIGMQETGLRQISRKQSVIIFDETFPNGWKKIRGHSDICMFQFHANTIVSHELDPIRLKDDLEYCIEQHFILMKHKRNICKKLKEDSWTCYHSINKVYREQYKKLVERYFQ